MVWQLEKYECPSCKQTHPLVWAHPRDPDRSMTYEYTCPVTHETVGNVKLKDIKTQVTFAAPQSVHLRRPQ